jgi:uncharacterized RDD family membrane protein YckC
VLAGLFVLVVLAGLVVLVGFVELVVLVGLVVLVRLVGFVQSNNVMRAQSSAMSTWIARLCHARSKPTVFASATTWSSNLQKLAAKYWSAPSGNFDRYRFACLNV